MNFRDLPIRRKLALLILAATVFAVTLACIGFAIYERQLYRSHITSDVTALADTLGANTAASLAFNDQKTATAMLGALRAESNVLAASLYDDHGNVFAEYRRPGLDRAFNMPGWQPDGARFTHSSLTLFRSVSLDGDRMGSIGIASDRVEKSIVAVSTHFCPGAFYLHPGHLSRGLAPDAHRERSDRASG